MNAEQLERERAAFSKWAKSMYGEAASLWDAWQARAQQQAASAAPVATEQPKLTDLSVRLRAIADQQPGWRDILTSAADEIERYYGGMLAWKAAAEAKDRAVQSPAMGLILRDDQKVLTYQNQPGNVEAWRLGEACSVAARERAGDYIDTGLALLKALQDKGFGVVRIGALGAGSATKEADHG